VLLVVVLKDFQRDIRGDLLQLGGAKVLTANGLGVPEAYHKLLCNLEFVSIQERVVWAMLACSGLVTLYFRGAVEVQTSEARIVVVSFILSHQSSEFARHSSYMYLVPGSITSPSTLQHVCHILNGNKVVGLVVLLLFTPFAVLVALISPELSQ
jgi:hypothetical protein